MKWTLLCWRTYLCLILLIFSSATVAASQLTIQSATQQLVEFNTYINMGKKPTTQQLATIKQTAEIRKKLILNAIEKSQSVATFLLSTQITHTLPSQVLPYLEKEIGPINGRLEIRAATSNEQQEILQYVLLTGNEIYYLHFNNGAPPTLETDGKMHISKAYLISGKDNIQNLIVNNKDVSFEKPRYALPLSLGPQKTLTYLVNFSDKPNDRPWTLSQMNTLVFTTVSNYFLEASYQQTSLTGQTVGWYVVNVPSTSCNTDQMAALADQAAINAGIDISKFNRKVYIFPKTSACSWAGLGNVGGANTRSWINGAVSDLRTTAHELGHNFGIYHSRLLTCTNSPNTGTCSRNEYGDGTDIMGAARTSHFNAHQKDRLGWLNYQASPPITTVNTSGTYTIDAYETKNSNPKALKVLKTAGGSDYYYLEFRQGIGFDKELANCSGCDYTKGVIFHQGSTTIGNTNDLLDMSPENKTSGVVALLPGKSWTDSTVQNGGVTFQVVSVASTGAVVKITFGGGNPNPGETELTNGTPVTNLSGTQSSENFYFINVPAGTPKLTITTAGGTGDADLYVKYLVKPTQTQYDCRPYTNGNNETCTINNPPAGKYYVMLRGYTAYSGVSLSATY